MIATGAAPFACALNRSLSYFAALASHRKVSRSLVHLVQVASRCSFARSHVSFFARKLVELIIQSMNAKLYNVHTNASKHPSRAVSIQSESTLWEDNGGDLAWLMLGRLKSVWSLRRRSVAARSPFGHRLVVLPHSLGIQNIFRFSLLFPTPGVSETMIAFGRRVKNTASRSSGGKERNKMGQKKRRRKQRRK